MSSRVRLTSAPSVSLAACVGIGCLLSTSLADAHISLTEPPMRNGDQKSGPCEGAERGDPTEYEAGSTITVTFNETVDHPGYFRISFDEDGDDFDSDGDGVGDFPPHPDAPDTGNGGEDFVLMDVEDDGSTNYSVDVTLPNVACDNCTLQVIQIMSERMPSAMNPTAHLYFRCADVVLTGGEDPPMGGAGGEGAGGGDGMGEGGSAGMGMGGMPGIEEPEPMLPMGGGGAMPMMPEPSDPISPGGMPGEPPAGEPMVGGDPIPPAPATTTPTTPTPTTMPQTGTQPTATPSPSTSGSANGLMTASDSGDDGGCAIVSPKRGSSAAWLAIFLGVALPLLRRHRR